MVANLEKREETAANERLLFLLVMLMILVTRLPFLDAAYGSEPDAWYMANAARSIAATGQYIASRLPGYPIPEISYSLIWTAGPLAQNLMTAVLSIFGIACFALIARELGARGYLLAGIALAFTPVIYINSTDSMDYLWAFAFLQASMYLVITRKPLLAGACLGIAIGCRITSGAMLLPLSVMMLAYQDHRLAGFLTLAGSALVVGGLAYVPVFGRYGVQFFSYSNLHEPLPLTFLAKITTEDVWGIIGTAAILALLVIRALSPGAASEDDRALPRVDHAYEWAWILGIILYGIAFVELPHKPGYLIPMVPLVLLLLMRLFRRWQFAVLTAALVLSPFLVYINDYHVPGMACFSRAAIPANIGGKPIVFDALYGPLLSDTCERQEVVKYVQQVISTTGHLPGKAIVVAGRWMPWTDWFLPARSQGETQYVYFLERPQQLQTYLRQGYKVYYLYDQPARTRENYGFDPLVYGAKLLPPSP